MRKSGRWLLSGGANVAACVGPGVLTVTQVKNAVRTAPFASARPVLASKRGPVRMTFEEQIENDLLLFFPRIHPTHIPSLYWASRRFCHGLLCRAVLYAHHHAGVIWRGAAVG